MQRRDFLKILASSATAAYTMDWEKLLWVPGEKKIFIPPETIFLDYKICVPYVNSVIYTGWDYVEERKITWGELTREEAIKRRILIKGQGLEDIDIYMKHIQDLEKKR